MVNSEKSNSGENQRPGGGGHMPIVNIAHFDLKGPHHFLFYRAVELIEVINSFESKGTAKHALGGLIQFMLGPIHLSILTCRGEKLHGPLKLPSTSCLQKEKGTGGVF